VTREIQNTTGCHTSALGELFIPDESGKAQGGIDFFEEGFTELVLGSLLFAGGTPQ
jgi:hypothetical protein